MAYQRQLWKNRLPLKVRTGNRSQVWQKRHKRSSLLTHNSTSIPQNLELKADVAEGRIGEIKFIDASARSTPVDQAPHVLQLVSSYIDNSRPVRVLGQIAGNEQLDSAQPSPMHAAGHVLYENGLHVSVAFGTGMGTLASDSESTVAHKRVFVVGTKGFVHWRFSSWERATPEGGYEGGPLNYGEQDIAAQGNLTEAVFDWLDDENNVHPTPPQAISCGV